jgi:hypothetical protein
METMSRQWVPLDEFDPIFWNFPLKVAVNFDLRVASLQFLIFCEFDMAAGRLSVSIAISPREMPAISERKYFAGVFMRSILHRAVKSIRLNSSAMNKSGKNPNEC